MATKPTAAQTRELRSLQIAVAIAGLVPVSAGLSGALGGLAFMGTDTASIPVDSHFRYLSGLLLGIGIAFWCMIPTLASSTGPARLLTFIVFIGGLARLYGWMLHGDTSAVVIFALVMELIVTPGLCLWQARVAAQR